MKASNAALYGLIIFTLGFFTGMLTYQRFRPYVQVPVIEVRSDTVVVRDTVTVPIPAPRVMGTPRVDTIRLEIKPADSTKLDTVTTTPAKPDTSSGGLRLQPDGSITVPIEQLEYRTDDYRAVVEGWRPRLVSMTVYPKTTIVTREVTKTVTRRPWLAVSLGPSIGYNGKTVAPAISATVGVVLWSK